MRPRFFRLLGGVLLGLGLGWSSSIEAVWAQIGEAKVAEAKVGEAQVERLSNALRQVAQQTPPAADLHSDWQIKASTLTQWSKQCVGKALTPQEFVANPTTPRRVVVCVLQDVLKTENKTAKQDEALAVRRVAAWWLTGDAAQYNTPGTAQYTQKVLAAYKKSASSVSIEPSVSPKPVIPKPATPKPVTPKPATESSGEVAITKVTASRTGPYDRYMQEGYKAFREKNYSRALLNFRRALDERPKDDYATKAITNAEARLVGVPKPDVRLPSTPLRP